MDSSWYGWVQENLERRCDPEEILGILLKNNFSLPDIQHAMGKAFPAASAQLKPFQPPPAAADAQTAYHRKRDSLIAIQHRMRRLAPRSLIIERRYDNVSRAEFLEKYYAANKPVILCGCMKYWAALTRWTPDYLKAACGEEMVEITVERDRNPAYEMEIEKHRRPIRFADYVDMVNRGETNDYYLVARNDFFQKPGARALLRDIQIFPEYLKLDFSGHGINMWYGPKGTVTPLHHDTMNIFMAQVQGRKRIKLIPADELDMVYNNFAVYSQVDAENPDYARFPKYRDATVMECELAPGEVLFLPVGWWHHVRALDASITLSFTSFLFPNDFQWEQPPGDNAIFVDYAQPAQQKLQPHMLSVTLPNVDYQALHEARITRNPAARRFDNPRLQLYVLDDFMSAEECDALIAIINRDLRPSTVTIDNGDKYFRTSKTSDLYGTKDPLVGVIDDKIAATLGIRLPYSEAMQAQKYETGQEFKSHTDYFEPRTHEYLKFATEMGNRTWTFMVYLNDTPKGGGTRFTKIGHTFYPQKGQAVIWNNLYANGAPNPDTEHHGMPVEEGEKYIITKWFREKGSGPMFYE